MLAAQSDTAAGLDILDRLELNGIAAEVGVQVERITRTLAGVDLEREFARLLDQHET